MENMIKNKMRKTQMELENLNNNSTLDYGVIWKEGYLNGQLKVLDDLLSVIAINNMSRGVFETSSWLIFNKEVETLHLYPSVLVVLRQAEET